MRTLRRTPLLACAAFVALGAPLAGAEIIAQSNWDPPAWTVGVIAGQNGWTNFNAAAGHQVVAAQGGVTPFSGTQMHLSTPSTQADTERDAYIDVTSAWAGRTGGNIARGSMMVYLPSTSTAPSQFGGLFYTTSGTGVGWLLSTVTGAVSLLDSSGALTATGLTVPRNTWTGVVIDFDTAAGLLSVQVAGSAGATSVSTAALAITDFDLANFSDPVSPSASPVVFTDDYRLEAVPAPGAAGLLGAAGVFGARRRRRA